MNNNEPTDHTADLILEFRGADLEELFSNAALSMLGAITPLDSIGERVEERIRLRAPNLGELLVCWLNELLFFLDGRGLLLVKYGFETINERELVAWASGEEVDLSRREVGTEIKAATYHDLLVEKIEDGWIARLLFDI